jgi:hypothetical protein
VVDDRRAEIAARDALGGRLEPEQSVREHARRGESEDQREREREGGREQQALPHDLDGCERVRERHLEEENRLGAGRNRDLRVVAAPEVDAALLDLSRQHRGPCDRIALHVAGAPRLRVGDREERGLRLRQDAEGHDPGIRRDPVALHPVLPEQRSLRKLVRERHTRLPQLLQASLDEPPLEGRHDDHVRRPERPGDDADEDEDDTGPDSARQGHGNYSDRKR